MYLRTYYITLLKALDSRIGIGELFITNGESTPLSFPNYPLNML